MDTPLPLNTVKVLIITPDVLGERMAGPAIRALEIARALHPACSVTLVSTVENTLSGYDFPIRHVDDDRLRGEVAAHDVLIVQGTILSGYPWIVKSDAVIIADIYDPMQLEILEQGKQFPPGERMEHTLNTAEALNVQIERADFMVCASEKQRDLWLGQLGALCRINPYTYDSDPSLRNLIEVAPFGIQEEAPERRRHGIKGTVPGISADDRVILWGGGIYNWFDPLTLIRAMKQLSEAHPDLKLYFLGAQHPNPHVPAMRMAAEARALAEELGLLGRHVFFNREWVKYEERADYLLDADLGVSTHFDHVETAFSFRTRILDYLWAGLPIVATDGDTFAEVIRRRELGIVIPPEDVAALAAAIETSLYDAEERARFLARIEEYREEMTWSRTLEPLVAFCRDPRHAADYGRGVVSPRESHVRHLTQRIEDLESSTSWRLTRPLRALNERLQRRS